MRHEGADLSERARPKWALGRGVGGGDAGRRQEQRRCQMGVARDVVSKTSRCQSKRGGSASRKMRWWRILGRPWRSGLKCRNHRRESEPRAEQREDEGPDRGRRAVKRQEESSVETTSGRQWRSGLNCRHQRREREPRAEQREVERHERGRKAVTREEEASVEKTRGRLWRSGLNCRHDRREREPSAEQREVEGHDRGRKAVTRQEEASVENALGRPWSSGLNCRHHRREREQRAEEREVEGHDRGRKAVTRQEEASVESKAHHADCMMDTWFVKAPGSSIQRGWRK